MAKKKPDIDDDDDDEGFYWRDHLGNSLPERIVYKILNDLTDRRGLRQAFESIDDEIQRELMDTWVKIVKKEIRSSP